MYQTGSRRLIVTFCIIVLVFSGLQARGRGLVRNQRNGESGSLFFSMGPNYCFADPDCSKGFTGPVANQGMLENQDITFGYKQDFTDELGLKALISYENYTGSDIKSPRNFSFKSTAFQFAVIGEYSYHFSLKRKYYSNNTPNRIYGFAGLSAMAINAKLNRPMIGGVYPYDTYGYTFKPTSVAPVIPYGFGYSYQMSDEFAIGVEFIWRYTFSDYLDGFKPPLPSSISNDVMQGVSFTMAYKLF
jgi:hypothetical protein